MGYFLQKRSAVYEVLGNFFNAHLFLKFFWTCMIEGEPHINAEYLQFKSLAIVLGLLPSVRDSWSTPWDQINENSANVELYEICIFIDCQSGAALVEAQ